MLSVALPRKCLHCANPTDDRQAPLSHYLCEVCLRVLTAEESVAEQRLQDQLRRTARDIQFEELCSLHSFSESSPIRSIIHAAKYEGMMRLGLLLGSRLSEQLDVQRFDVVVPVPLHRTRRAERGYNQADQLAFGIARSLTMTNAVKRVRPTKTQTHLNVEGRLQNVRGAFALTRNSAALQNKRILIVDDVMTTGATIASVAEAVLLANPTSVSVATIAVAEHSDIAP